MLKSWANEGIVQLLSTQKRVYYARLILVIKTMSKESNYVTETMFVSRITCKGKVESLEHGFRLKDEQPFSVYIRPKTLTTMERDVLLNCKLYKEDAASEVPVPLFGWVELEVVEIAPSASLLSNYDIYWGAGDYGVPVYDE